MSTADISLAENTLINALAMESITAKQQALNYVAGKLGLMDTFQVTQTAGGDAQSAADKLINQAKADAASIRAAAYSTVAGEIAALAAISFIPFTNNFAGHAAAGMILELARPLTQGAIVDPLMDYMHQLFPTRHISPRILITAIQKGALTEVDLVNSAMKGGLILDDVTNLLKVARVYEFETTTKTDVALIATYNRDILLDQVAVAKVDINDNITLVKIDLKVAQKQLKAGDASYVPDVTGYDISLSLGAETPRKALTRIMANLNALKKQLANVAVSIIGAQVSAAQARIDAAKQDMIAPYPGLTLTPSPPPVTLTPTPITGSMPGAAKPDAVTNAAFSACLGFSAGDPAWPACSKFDLNSDGTVNMLDNTLLGTGKYYAQVGQVVPPIALGMAVRVMSLSKNGVVSQMDQAGVTVVFVDGSSVKVAPADIEEI